MIRKLSKPQTEKQQRAWRHNALFGSVAMTKWTMHIIGGSVSTTPQAKYLAGIIQELTQELYAELNNRVEADGTITVRKVPTFGEDE